MFIKRTENNVFTNWWLAVDKNILITVAFLIGVGILMLFSASPYVARRVGLNDFAYIKKFAIYFWIGIFTLLTTSLLSTKRIRQCAILSFIPCFIALISTLFFAEIKGGKRWVNLGGFALQPSEFLKPIFAVVIAMLLVRIKDLHLKNKKTKNPIIFIENWWKNEKERNYTFLLLGLFILIVLVLLKQPDAGMTATFGIIFGTELFVAGLAGWCVWGLIGMAVFGFILAYNYLPHFTNRVNMFLTGSNEQLDLGLNAIRKAGFLGNHTNNLKTKVPDVHTDFIFSAMVEEFGAILAAFVIIAFFTLALHVFLKLKDKNNNFVIFACTGIISYLTFQVLVNISSTLGIIPTKGMTLPFISYGGSSFISSCLAIGIILSLLQDQNLRR